MAAMSTSSLKTLAALSLRRSHSLTHSLPHRALSLLSPLPPSPHSLTLSPPSLTLPTRGFKSTPYFEFAKKKKGGKGGKGSECESEGDAPAPPDIKQVEVQMEQRLTHLREEFSRMHNSRVSKDMFNHVMVEAYGSKSAVPECGQVSVQTASKVVINVFDAAIVPAVTKALRDCGLNLNPIVDGSMVSVPIPKASKEKREDMVKLAKKAGEKTKQEVRHIRKVTMDRVKDLKNSISEDDVRKSTKDVDALTEKKVKAVDAEVKAKEKDIMS